jgi:hypothetical protein
MPIIIKTADGQTKKIENVPAQQQIKEIIKGLEPDSLAASQVIAYHLGLGTEKQRQAIEEDWHPDWFDVHFTETQFAEKMIPPEVSAEIKRHGPWWQCLMSTKDKGIVGQGVGRNIGLAISAALVELRGNGWTLTK